jgi:hypothetical protein
MNKLFSKLWGLDRPRKVTIKREIIRMIWGALFLLTLSLAFIAIPLENERSYWIPAVICAGLEIVFLLSVSLLSERLKRAYDFNIFIMVIYMVAFIGMLEIDIWLFFVLLGSQAWLFIILGLISLISGFIVQIKVIRNKLSLAREFNIASGRLSEKTGEWNLAAVLRLDAPEIENGRLRFWKTIQRFIMPFLPAVGMALNRNLGQQSDSILFGILVYLMTLVVFWGIARYPAIALFLLERERVLGKKIILVAKHE